MTCEIYNNLNAVTRLYHKFVLLKGHHNIVHVVLSYPQCFNTVSTRLTILYYEINNLLLDTLIISTTYLDLVHYTGWMG